MRRLSKYSKGLALATLLALHLPLAASPARAVRAGNGSDRTDSRAGVAAAAGCGVAAGLAVRTGNPIFFGLAGSFCAFMIIDALATPD